MNTVLKFGARWCAPCKALEPHLAERAGKSENLFMDIDVDALDDSEVSHFKIGGVPLIIVLDAEGNEIERVVGGRDTKAILPRI